jgi:hypothetical protein
VSPLDGLKRVVHGSIHHRCRASRPAWVCQSTDILDAIFLHHLAEHFVPFDDDVRADGRRESQAEEQRNN